MNSFQKYSGIITSTHIHVIMCDMLPANFTSSPALKYQ